MLIPRFTVRWLLGVTVICALVALVLSLAVSGTGWAVALGMTLGSAALIGLLYGATFCLAWLGALAFRAATRRRAPASPFAMHTPPPQIIVPDNPD